MTGAHVTAVVTTLDIAVEPYEWAFPQSESARIAAHWRAERARMPRLYDGRVMLARDVHAERDTLSGRAFETGYSNFLSWRDFDYPGAGNGAGAGIVNFFAMPALRSADGAFLLGRMSAGTANAGRLYFPAGTPEPADFGADGRFDGDASILRELEEETGLDAADVTLGATWTVIFAGPLVACMKVAQADAPAADLEARVGAVIAAQSAPELDGLYAVRGSGDFDRTGMPEFMITYLEGSFAGRPAQAR